MPKSSAIAPANIAFVKHWGLSNEGLPLAGSLSMNLDACTTHSTVEFLPNLEKDEIWMENALLDPKIGRNQAAYTLIEEFRQHFALKEQAKVLTKNSFPSDSGLASSASGFSALATALLGILGEEGLEKRIEWTTKSRSFSAPRSLADDFGLLDQNLSVKPLQTPLKLVSLIVGVSQEKKSHTSLQGHQVAFTSPLQAARLQKTTQNLQKCEEALISGDFPTLMNIIEEETLLLHAVMFTSRPNLIYWEPLTLELLQASQSWKSEIPFAFSIDAGSTVHLIVEEQNLPALRKKVQDWGKAAFILEARPCRGAHLTDQHLF